jgi:hypothetical protein
VYILTNNQYDYNKSLRTSNLTKLEAQMFAIFKKIFKPKESPFSLSEDEIIERLRTDDSEVINTIYQTCLELLTKEDERSKLIDTKGSALLGMSGLSASVVFSLGGILIEKIINIPLLVIGCPIPSLVIFYFTSSATLLLTLLFTLLAIRTRSDWRDMKDEDIFQVRMIEEGINPYKRYMTVHAWKIYQNNFSVNEKKGRNLKIAHWLFFGALLQLLPIILIIGLYSSTRGGIL